MTFAIHIFKILEIFKIFKIFKNCKVFKKFKVFKNFKNLWVFFFALLNLLKAPEYFNYRWLFVKPMFYLLEWKNVLQNEAN